MAVVVIFADTGMVEDLPDVLSRPTEGWPDSSLRAFRRAALRGKGPRATIMVPSSPKGQQMGDHSPKTERNTDARGWTKADRRRRCMDS